MYFKNKLYLCIAKVYYNKLQMVLKDTLKERRSQLKISQFDLAEMAGVSLATVKDIERGKGNPSLQTVEKILAVLGMEITYQLRQTV